MFKQTSNRLTQYWFETMSALCRKPKLIQEFWTAANGKADLRIRPDYFGLVREAEFSIGINNAVRGDHLANNGSFARLIFAAR